MAVSKDRIGGLWLIYGIPGTGKTLLGGLADGIIPAVRNGRPIFTNITGLSVGGISCVSGIPPIAVDLNFVETTQDVINAFDSEHSTGALFVLDEMRSMLGADEKAINWLTQRLNIMRKRGCDFIMIAQVPSYFPSEIRELAKGCSLYKRLLAFGSKSKTREYRWDAGTPRIVGNKPVDYAGFSIRTLDPLLFTCYDSYIDSQIKGNEDSSRRDLVWTSPKAIIAYLFIFFVVLFIGFGIFFFFKIKGEFGDLGGRLSGHAPASAVSSNDSLKAVTYEPIKENPCYSYIICDSLVCKTSVGAFPADSYDSVVGGVVTPSGVLSLCDDSDKLPR